MPACRLHLGNPVRAGGFVRALVTFAFMSGSGWIEFRTAYNGIPKSGHIGIYSGAIERDGSCRETDEVSASRQLVQTSPMAALLAPDWLLPVIAAPFVGSFLGSLAKRLPAGEPVVVGRSMCPICGHRLGLRDLVPLASWLVSGGRCRYCAAAVGAFYPAVEVAALVVAVWAASMFSGWLLWTSCVFGWTLLALATIDQRDLLLPDALTLPLIPAGLAVAYAIEPARLGDHAIGAGLGFLAFAAIGWVYRRVRGREGLGLGDAKLLAGAGAWVSWSGLASIVLVAALAALAVVLARWLAGRAPSPTERVPFGPYLCLGAWLVWLYGPVMPG